MQFPRLENIKAKYPSLSRQLDDLAAYIVKEAGRGNKEIEPSLAAQSLGTSEAEVLGLLMLFEQEGLLKHVYNIYCGDKRTFLKSVYEKGQIPATIYCRYCDKEHTDPDEFEIELAFQILDSAWEPLHQNVAAR